MSDRCPDLLGCDLYGQGEAPGLGGAIWSRNVDLTCIDSDFDGNEAGKGGGAIWFQAFILGDGSGSYPYFGDADLTMEDCTFRDNQTTLTDAGTIPEGGGGLFMDGMKAQSASTNLEGEISGCTFIDNGALRGGGIYIHNADRIDITASQTGPCVFINNAAIAAGGGIGIGDPGGLGTTEVYVCKSTFISNTAQKGGAVHNHEGATTYMVNCYITGNESTQEGGGVFNSRHTSGQKAVMHMHNCLIGGNVAGTDGGGVFNGLTNNDPNTNEAEMEMVHCTLVGNYADGSYGGALNVASDSALRFYNSITRDNTSDSIADTFKNQLFHVAGYTDDDANNFVAAGTLPSPYSGDTGLVWTAGDPVFTEDGSSTVTWTACVYDPDTGETTFTTSNPGSAAAGMLFQPDGPETPMLIVSSVGNTSIVCLGWRSDAMSVSITGNLYDLHIDDSGSAYEFGDPNHYPFDWCDLVPLSDELSIDLDLEDRGETPEAGAYEVPE